MTALSLFFFANDTSPADEQYRLVLEGARFADEHGLHSVWTPERHFHPFGGIFPNPAVLSAALAATTRRVGLRAGSVVLPLHHPVRVVEDWALVDNLSHGRVGISLASGWQADDFILAPARYAQRAALVTEEIAVLRALWRGDEATFPGHDGAPVRVGTRPRPVQAELPLWLTIARRPEAYIDAGRLGVHVLTHLLSQTRDELEPGIRAYRAAWREAGHAGQGWVTLMLHTFVDEDEARARALCAPSLQRYLESAFDLGLGREGRTVAPATRDRMIQAAVERHLKRALVGTPGHGRAVLDDLGAAGVDEVACLIDFGLPTDQVLASLPRLAALAESRGA